jgi:hypothetical protein
LASSTLRAASAPVIPLAGRTEEYLLNVVFTFILAQTEKIIAAKSKIKYVKSK